jgi:hypothetical protein
MALYVDRLTRMSTLFNVGGKQRFTPKDLQHVVMLSEFRAAADVFLQSTTFHDEYTKLINAETVPFWQGSGTDYAFSNTSKIDAVSAAGHSQIVTGVLGSVLAIPLKKVFRLKSDVAWGLATGTACHAGGTAAIIKENDVAGAMSSLSIIIAGIIHVVLVPLVVGLY